MARHALKPRINWLYAAEWLLVIGLAVFAARNLLQMGPDLRVRGQEFSYLIGSGAVADVIYDATGGIPLWNSWMGRGEPLLENSFSYVNNPFMFFPVLAWGMYDGAKIAAVLHAVIAGLGGWLLGYVIGLKTGGRLLAAFLFAGSGSIVGAVGMGFYQMGLSQAYVPWVYAGLLATLRRNDRWSIGVLVVAASLLIFAGTFWYVLPTAIGCALLIAFHLFERSENGRWQLNRRALRRLGWATLLLLLVSATRLIPQTLNHAYVDHVGDYLPNPARDFLLTAGWYFSPTLTPEYPIAALHFYYTVVPAFLITLLVGRALIIPVGGKTPGTWRVVIPAALLLFLFTSWGQEGGVFWASLYDTLPLLKQWRLVTRMLAAGAPFLILIAAIWFDDLINAAVFLVRSHQHGRIARFAAALAAIGLIAFGAWAAADILANWERESGVEPVGREREAYLTLLRLTRPDELISLQEWGFFNYFDHHELLIRTAYGNPDYRAKGLSPTLGTVEMMDYPAPEAIEYDDEQARWLEEMGYIAQPSPDELLLGTHWMNPSIPPYAFIAPESVFSPERTATLQADEVTAASYQYQLDTITVTVPQSSAGDVVVVTETAYPGWRVTVNGQPAALESVGGLIGVRLAESAEPGVIQFNYRPALLIVSSLVTLAGAALLTAYLLRLDVHLRRMWQKRSPVEASEPVMMPVLPVDALAPAAIPFVEDAADAEPPAATFRQGIVIGILAASTLLVTAGAAVIAVLLRRKRPENT